MIILGLAPVVGGVVAGVILVAVIIIVACYVIRRRNVGKKESAPWSSNGGVTLDVRTHVSYIFLKIDICSEHFDFQYSGVKVCCFCAKYKNVIFKCYWIFMTSSFGM